MKCAIYGAFLSAMGIVLAMGCSNSDTGKANKQTTPAANSAEHADDGHTHDDSSADKHEHADDHSHGGNGEMKGRVEKLSTYEEAVEHLEQLRAQISGLIESGKLSEVHPPAEEIALAARRLPELASKSNIPRENWKAITTESRDLANLFGEIDEAADAGKKPETEIAFSKMQKLIDSLKAQASK